jgi:protein involved in polysaccharide export with SLBB domain
MRKSQLLVLFVICSASVCLSQYFPDSSSQGANSQNTAPDCTDPLQAGTVACSAALSQRSSSVQGRDSSSTVITPVLRGSPNADQLTPATPPLNPSQIAHSKVPIRPETEFEQMVADSIGRVLPLFGQSLFAQPPSTFSPVDWMLVPSDYIVGPGDELQIKIWGQVQADLRAIVDRSGQIYVPQVGQIPVAGVHYGDLEPRLKSEISKVFKNFNLTANIGRLHSIQVLLVGNARYPGTYTISSLSTLVNAIFASGGPAPQGTLRHIQVRRNGTTITDFDFYDLLIHGDKSKDVRLEPGDVLYIPHVGPLVAIAGSVNTPAIYEVKDNSTLNDLIEIAGNLSNVADTSKIVIDRFSDQARKTLEFPWDAQSRAVPLKDGDIVRVLSIVPRFEDTVTLRGNVSNPGRYPWKPGMRVRDLIPNAQALLTRGYWRDRADIVTGRATEYPVSGDRPQIGRLGSTQPQSAGNNPTDTAARGTVTNAVEPSGNFEDNSIDGAGFARAEGAAAAEIAQDSNPESPLKPGDKKAADNPPPSTGGNSVGASMVRNVAKDVRRYAPEINWDYAIIQRVNPEDLSSKLIWMSPRKSILERDESSNLELEAGDIVTIFSQRDVNVPQANRSQYVIVEGEVMRPGVYKLEANETLRSVLERAGGLSPKAYVYGAQLFRESAREKEQKSLDELARSMEVQVRQSAVSLAAYSTSGELPQLLAAQEAIIAQIHNARATGRVALPVRPIDHSLTDFPDIAMEDNDRLNVPHTPSTVSVVGSVYNPGSFIFEPRNTAGEYLEMAGKGKPQSDLHHAFVLRANGVVVAANNVNGAFVGTRFDRLRLYPGDQIVVPYKLPTGAFVRGLRDWTQIASQLAVTGVVLATVLP